MDPKNTREFLDFCFALIRAYKASMSNNGKLGYEDLAFLTEPMMKLMPALGDISELEREIRHLDAASRASLVQYVKDNFDLEDDKVEGLIEEGLALGLQVVSFLYKI